MDLVLKNKYKIQLLAQSASLQESIDGIAYTLSLSLTGIQGLEDIGIAKGDSIELYDYEFRNNSNYIKIFDGVIWEVSGSKKSKKISITGKERTVYIEESEDEYIWAQGQTAMQRGRIIADDWGITVGNIEDTKIGLAKDRRRESLYSMMWKDLKETAQKGGSLYRYRMGTSLDLVEIGSNNTIYKLDSIVEEVQKKQSLSGAVTAIKVFGKNESEDAKTPIIGTFKKDTDTYGTIQKILQDEKVNDYASAKTKSDSKFSSGEDSLTVNCVEDINTLRAGHKVKLYNNDYYVTDITHTLGGKGSMDLTLYTWEGVKAKFYGE